jgi:iron(III) transport system permease protein
VTPFIGAIAWSLLLSPRVGYLNHFFHAIGLPTVNIYSLGGMVWVMGIYEAPIVYLYLRPAMARMDRSLEEAGRVMGASPLATARSIVMPLLLPASLSALLLCFVNLLGQFAVPGVLGEPEGINVVPTYLVNLVQQYPTNPNAAAVLGVALTATTVVLLWLSNRVLGKRDYTTVVGKGRYEPGPTTRWMRAVGLVVIGAYAVIALILPIGMMLFASFQKVFTPDFGHSGFTLGNYSYVFSYPSLVTSITNTLVLALATAVLGSVLALLLGYIVVRTRLPGRRVVEQIALAPVAIPPSVFGLALLWTWITLPVGVYDTRTILLLAYLALFLPYTTRAAIGAFQQVSVDLEDASRVLGGSWLLTLRRIVTPLVGPAILSGAIIMLYNSVRELAASLLLYSIGTQVIAVAIWEMFNQGQYLDLFAMSMVQIAIVFALVLVVRLLGRRFVGVDLAQGAPG